MNIHILFIQSSIDGHLTCFYLTVFVNRALLNICVSVFEYLFSILLDKYLVVELLAHMIIICLAY